MSRLRIEHRTGYRYDNSVTLSYNEARMTPLTDSQQVVLESSLTVSPSSAVVSNYRDYWGTRVTAFDMQTAHDFLEVTSLTTVEVHRSQRLPAVEETADWDVLRSVEFQNALWVTVRFVQEATGVSQPASQNAIDQLVEADLAHRDAALVRQELLDLRALEPRDRQRA